MEEMTRMEALTLALKLAVQALRSSSQPKRWNTQWELQSLWATTKLSCARRLQKPQSNTSASTERRNEAS